MIIFHYGIITFQRVHLDTVLDMKKNGLSDFVHFSGPLPSDIRGPYTLVSISWKRLWVYATTINLSPNKYNDKIR